MRKYFLTSLGLLLAFFAPKTFGQSVHKSYELGFTNHNHYSVIPLIDVEGQPVELLVGGTLFSQTYLPTESDSTNINLLKVNSVGNVLFDRTYDAITGTDERLLHIEKVSENLFAGTGEIIVGGVRKKFL